MLIRNWLQKQVRGVPWSVVVLAYTIMILGLLNLYSASGQVAYKVKFWDQIRWMLLGTCIMIFWGNVLTLKMIQKLTWLAYFGICSLLILVSLSGLTAKGAQRWFSIGGFVIQPSEMTKLVMILVVAKILSHQKFTQIVQLYQLWKEVLIMGIPVLFVITQPDLGTGGLIVLVMLCQWILVRIPLRQVFYLGLLCLVILIFAWFFVLYDYQKERILNFIWPQRDPRGSGYQSIQSIVAVGSGQLWGKGFMKGTQAHLKFLPERHTDFILSVWAEEQGFIGIVLLFSLYFLFLMMILRIIERCRDPFGKLVSLGVLGFFIWHVLINSFMVLGIFPIVGVPLSFMSYGGSHLISAMSCLGLLIAIERARLT